MPDWGALPHSEPSPLSFAPGRRREPDSWVLLALQSGENGCLDHTGPPGSQGGAAQPPTPAPSRAPSLEDSRAAGAVLAREHAWRPQRPASLRGQLSVQK